VDKIEREPAESLNAKLAPFGLAVADLQEFIRGGFGEGFRPMVASLDARGLGAFIETDLSIVRGLAYYTGVVFEVFDRSKKLRALAGGGRYDGLISGLSDGAVDLPAVGFGMGDVVLGNLIDEIPAAATKMPVPSACDLYVILADEAYRQQALAVVQLARENGWRTDFPIKPAKVGRQFQDAEHLKAVVAVVVGTEWPTVKWKDLATRGEETLDQRGLAERLRNAEKIRPV
jgi:histidyl-tRNA synthetase